MKQSTRRKGRESTAFLYSRLSRDDDLNGDSYSIKNQKILLAKVAKEKGYTNLVHFHDDGVSGVTMNRPGFNEMMDGLEKGKASAVFFKDMSRLGRNYIEVGRLCEEFFPENDIRYVAVSDGIDSDEGEDELTPIRNMFNEWYARDISKKRRMSNKIRGASGVPLSFPPYGYTKDPDNAEKWIIDPEAAGIVHRIFMLCVEGHGTNQIANILYDEKILTPTAYWQKKGIGRPGNKNNRGAFEWNHSTVNSILTKQEYCGDIINFKSYSKSYKNKKRIKNSGEDVMVFKDVHEAIISREIFGKVQNKPKARQGRKNHSGEKNMFSGLLRCPDCGGQMAYHINYVNRSIEYFNCTNNNKARKTCDKTHYIRLDFLEQVVLAEVRRLAQFVRDNEDIFINMVQKNIEQKGIEKNSFQKRELAELIARDKELDMLFERIYEDNATRKINDERFAKLSTKYEKEQISISERIDNIKAELEHQENLANSLDWFVRGIKKYTRIRKITPNILNELIDKIDVYHAEKIDGIIQQKLTIHFNCIGSIALPEMGRTEPVINMKTRKGVELNYSFG